MSSPWFHRRDTDQNDQTPWPAERNEEPTPIGEAAAAAAAAPRWPQGPDPDTVPFTGPLASAETAALVITLFSDIKKLEARKSGDWPGGDTVELLVAWFESCGIDSEDSPAAAARALRLPAHLAAVLTIPALRTSDLIIHLRTELNPTQHPFAEHVTAFLAALGTEASATIFDPAGNTITEHPSPGAQPTGHPGANSTAAPAPQGVPHV